MRRLNSFSQYIKKRCSIAKEISGTLVFVSSLRCSFVEPVKAAHIKDALFYSTGLCTLLKAKIYYTVPTSRRKSKTIIFLPYIQVSFIISTSDCENLKLKLIFLDRIVAKLFPVRKSFMQFGNSHQCTNSL